MNYGITTGVLYTWRLSCFPMLDKFLPRLVVAALTVTSIIILFQDLLIFPTLCDSKLFGLEGAAPKDVDVLSTVSSDGHTVPVWRVRAPQQRRDHVGLLFHGNAETLASFIHVQRWLQSIGVTTYSTRTFFVANLGQFRKFLK